jgi:hypothetical protein
VARILASESEATRHYTEEELMPPTIPDVGGIYLGDVLQIPARGDARSPIEVMNSPLHVIQLS